MLWGSLLGILLWPVSPAGRCEPLTEGTGFMALCQVQLSAFICNKLHSVAFTPGLRLEKLHNCTVQGCRGLSGENPMKSLQLEQDPVFLQTSPKCLPIYWKRFYCCCTCGTSSPSQVVFTWCHCCGGRVSAHNLSLLCTNVVTLTIVRFSLHVVPLAQTVRLE